MLLSIHPDNINNNNILNHPISTTRVHAISSRAFGWGNDMYGTLGVQMGVRAATPNKVSSLTDIVNITTSYQYLKLSEGPGYYSQYLLGMNDMTNPASLELLGMGFDQYLPSYSTGNSMYPIQESPVPFTIFGSNVLYVSTNMYVSVAVTKDAAQNFILYSWGDCKNGGLGDGDSTFRGVVRTPVKVQLPSPCQKSLKQFTQFDQAFLLCQDSERQYLYAYGNNNYNQMGVVNTPSGNSSTPIAVDLNTFGGKSLVKVLPGFQFRVALTSDSKIYVTGFGTNCFQYSTFTEVKNLPLSAGDFIVDIAVASQHVLMLTNTSKIIVSVCL